ncbi:hypothetical protein AB0B28_19705 [Glycomyces sp. NPDC046736]|uniref:DUF3885 domain-containing protein n=1 Tax=Glycomyces sp. NPDC046736 TaxID=3155615 RepID=UPI0033D63601
MHDKFEAIWTRRWPMELLAVPYELKERFNDRWVRFHCLPESKRYPENESEYAVILDRYNTILDELFSGGGVCIVKVKYDDELESSELPPPWRTVVSDEDPEFGTTYGHLFLERSEWRRGLIDEWLRGVADDRDPWGVVTDAEAHWLFHPYDGGMDVIAPSVADRDALRDRHRGWLSKHPQGY